MPIMKDVQLNRTIKALELAPVYFLYGAEVHLLKNTLRVLTDVVVSEAFVQFNLQRFDGETLQLNSLQSAYQALPMMAERKCVTVSNWQLDKLSKADFKALCDLLETPNPSTVLVLYYTKEIDVKKANIKKMIQLIKRQGVVCEFSLKDIHTLTRTVMKHCQGAGVRISPLVCHRLIEQCQMSYTLILNELEKMIAYVGQDGEITEHTVSLLASASVQATAFALSDAILKNKYQQAFLILDRLFYLRIEPVMVLGALSMSMVDLYRLKTAALCGLPAGQVIADFQYRSSYRIQKLVREVDRFSIPQIRNCIISLEKADRLLKSSRTEARRILEMMLGEMNSNNSSG